MDVVNWRVNARATGDSGYDGDFSLTVEHSNTIPYEQVETKGLQTWDMFVTADNSATITMVPGDSWAANGSIPGEAYFTITVEQSELTDYPVAYELVLNHRNPTGRTYGRTEQSDDPSDYANVRHSLNHPVNGDLDNSNPNTPLDVDSFHFGGLAAGTYSWNLGHISQYQGDRISAAPWAGIQIQFCAGLYAKVRRNIKTG